MKRLLAVLLRVTLVGALLLLAILWRDYGPTLPSSQWFVDHLAPNRNTWSLVDAGINALVLVAVFLVLRRVVRWLRYRARGSPKKSESESSSPFPIDKPITKSGEDMLSRDPVVNGVVELLKSSAAEDNSVIAIEGSWGGGKTSILRLVKTKLSGAESNNPIIIEFDPWPEDSKRGVVSRLLDVIAHSIGRADELHPGSREETERLLATLADSVAINYGQGQSDLFWRAIGWVDPLGRGSKLDLPTSLQANRQRIADAMSRLGRRLIVIVDDLDRVDQDELVAILMAVNALAQLPRTNFLLAFDPDVVDAVLESKGMKARQRSFREKIVHVSVPLPTPSFVDLSNLFRECFEGFLFSRRVVADWDFWDARLKDDAIIVCVRLLPTPRSLKRLANHATMVLQRLRREVNSADVLLMELVRARFPSVWQFIRQLRNQLDPQDVYSEGFIAADKAITSERLSADRPDAVGRRRRFPLEGALEALPAADRSDARQALLSIFPQLFSESRQESDRAESVRQSRVEIGSNLRKYFSLGVEGMQIADADVRALIADPDARSSIFFQASIGGFIEGMLSAVASHIDLQSPPADSEGLIEMIIEQSSYAWKVHSNDISEAAAALIEKIIRSQPEGMRPKTLAEVVRLDMSIATTHNVLLSLFQKADLWRHGSLKLRRPDQIVYFDNQLVPDEVLFSAKEAWLRTAWTVGIARLFASEPRPLRILFRMAQFSGDHGSYVRVREELWTFIQSRENLVLLVSEYSNQIAGLDTSVDGLEKLITNWDEFVRRVRGLSEPRDAVEKIIQYEENSRPGSRPA